MKTSPILFLSNCAPNAIGGMEMHAAHFLQHFQNHPRFPLCNEEDDPAFLFFNSGHWIEELGQLRAHYPGAKFLYRTGGNEVIKAPLSKRRIASHRERQAFWASSLNDHIDLLITNSAYTEGRLREIGVTAPFHRSVGGVDTSALRRPLRIFCAARFVPYKNHFTLIEAFAKSGLDAELRLAGEGPLLAATQRKAEEMEVTKQVSFLGKLDNREVLQEIDRADLYIQLSSDYQAEVEGGAYIHAEGMGRSILEAITARTFILAGKSGALEEIVTPDRGILIDPHDIDGIVAALRSRGLSDQYSWQRIFEQYEAAIDALA